MGRLLLPDGRCSVCGSYPDAIARAHRHADHGPDCHPYEHAHPNPCCDAHPDAAKPHRHADGTAHSHPHARDDRGAAG